MKKTPVLIGLLGTLFVYSYGQTAAVLNLKKNCYIRETTNELLPIAIKKQGKLRMIDADFYRQAGSIDSVLVKHRQIPENELADNIWSLISLQITGNAGLLSLKMPNWFLSKKNNELTIVIVNWNNPRKCWAVMYHEIAMWKETTQEARVFFYE